MRTATRRGPRRMTPILVGAAVLAGILLPRTAAAAGPGDAPAGASYPRVLHLSGKVCLAYRGAGGVLLARCHPAGGTWADVGPPVPLARVVGPPATAPAADVRDALAARRSSVRLDLGSGVLLTDGGVALSALGLWSLLICPLPFVGHEQCLRAAPYETGLGLGAVAVGIFLVDHLGRPTLAPISGASPGGIDALTLSTVAVGGGIALMTGSVLALEAWCGGPGGCRPPSDLVGFLDAGALSIGLVSTVVGLLILNIDGIRGLTMSVSPTSAALRLRL